MWSQEGEGRGLPLAAWDGINKSKDEGGLGFKLKKSFCQTLMGKQLANYFAKPSSIWAEVIKFKYSPSDNIWDLRLNRNVSLAWRDVVGGCEVLQRGLKWELGEASKIHLMHDPWVSSTPLRFWPIVPSSKGIVDNYRVHDFIRPGRQWDITQLMDIVGFRAVEEISKIPLLHALTTDCLRFLGDELKEFLVKKATNCS